MEKRIILGSGSPRRRELLEQIGIRFEIRTSDKEERYVSTKPRDIVEELARMKVEHVASELSDTTPLKNTIVIGADTIVALDGQILGKPMDEQHAFEMLKNLQGRGHEVYTGVAILDFDENGNRQTICHVEKTAVFIHEMEDTEIRAYIATGEPMDKAGAYAIQGCFGAYVDRIEGDYYTVVGLPLSYVYRQIKRLTTNITGGKEQ